MTHTVIGIYDNKAKAQEAMQELINRGFNEANIDISTSNNHNQNLKNNNADAGDSLSRFFNSLFGKGEEATRYTNVARRSSVVTVHASSAVEAQNAARIMDQFGSIDVAARASQSEGGTAGQSAATDTIPVIEEQMNVGKRVVETGGARLRSRIIEKPVEASIRLREEHIRVERNPVNRPATEADFANFKEGDFEMTERAEVPVVGKESRVVEEIRMSKEVEEKDEKIRGTVKSTEVKVDKLDPNPNMNRNASPASGTNRNIPNNPNVPPTSGRNPNMPPYRNPNQNPNQNPNIDPTKDPNKDPNMPRNPSRNPLK